MLLENKVAVIYGAGGPIGGAVARAFAGEGARVFLAGRSQAKLDQVANEIRTNGGAAETAVVNALDQQEVDRFRRYGGRASRAGRYLVQPHLVRRRPNAVDGDISGRFPSADRERHADAVPDDQGGCPTHDEAQVGSDPGVRWGWSANPPRAGRV